jgi:hypothetical protein
VHSAPPPVGFGRRNGTLFAKPCVAPSLVKVALPQTYIRDFLHCRVRRLRVPERSVTVIVAYLLVPNRLNAGYLLLNLVDWFGWLAATVLAGQVVAGALRSRITLSAEAF